MQCAGLGIFYTLLSHSPFFNTTPAPTTFKINSVHGISMEAGALLAFFFFHLENESVENGITGSPSPPLLTTAV